MLYPRSVVALLACALASASACERPESASAPASVAIPRAFTVSFPTQLLAADATASDEFGAATAVSSSGDTLVVGATRADGGKGAAYVFVLSNGQWVQQAKLAPTDLAVDDLFGSAVAVDGDRAVVGAFDQKGPLGYTAYGAAYVFERVDKSWIQRAKLSPAGKQATPWFGGSVGISGDTIVVGARYDIVDTNKPYGGAYVFVPDGGAWRQDTILRGKQEPNAYFGVSVAISGDLIAVGAAKEDVGTVMDAGAIYAFRRSQGVWTQDARLTSPAPLIYDELGASVATDGQTIAAGAPWGVFGSGAISSPPGAGRAYTFVNGGGTWTVDAQITGKTANAFGLEIAVAKDTMLVGWGLGGVAGGVAYLYQKSASGWAETIVQPLAGSIDESFGSGVALTPSFLLVGAEGWSFHNKTHPGYVYAFPINPGDNGAACGKADDCASRYCVDGVCCNVACGGGRSDDCQACSQRAGGLANGTCTPLVPELAARTVCRSAMGPCDQPESCDTSSTACPGDQHALDGTPCDDGKLCNGHELCSSGQCVSGQPVTCPDDGEPCTTATCQEGVGCQQTWMCTPDAGSTPPDAQPAAPDAQPAAPDAQGSTDGGAGPTALDGATTVTSLDGGVDGASASASADGATTADGNGQQAGDATTPGDDGSAAAGEDAGVASGDGAPAAATGDASRTDAAANGGGSPGASGCSCSVPARATGASFPAIVLPLALVLHLRSSQRRRRRR